MSARKRKDSSPVGAVVLICLVVGLSILKNWHDHQNPPTPPPDYTAERNAAHVKRRLADHERSLLELGQQLGRLRVAEERPCPVQLGDLHVGHQRYLAWIGLGRHGAPPEAPGSQSIAFDHAANRVNILNPDPVAREKELSNLFAAPHIAIAIPTRFEQARRAAEAPGFTGGTFSGYVAVIAMQERTIICSAKLDVQIESVANFGGAELDDLSNWQSWDKPFREGATAALRRIGGPRAAMAQ